MTAFDVAATLIAADPNIGSGALYTAQGEPPLALRVVLTREENPQMGVGSGMITAGWSAMIPASAIPDRLQRGELLSVGTQDFTIETAEMDEASASWFVRLRKA